MPVKSDAYIDISTAGIFTGYIERIIRDEGIVPAEKIDLVLKVYTRGTQVRDRYLKMILEVIGPDPEHVNELDKIWRLIKLKNNRRQAGLTCLNARHFADKDMTFDEEYDLIVKVYFPEASGYRDDLLKSLEDRKVSSRKQLEKLCNGYTFEYSRALNKDVAQRREKKDNLAYILDKLNIDSKLAVIEWLMGFCR